MGNGVGSDVPNLDSNEESINSSLCFFGVGGVENTKKDTTLKPTKPFEFEVTSFHLLEY